MSPFKDDKRDWEQYWDGRRDSGHGTNQNFWSRYTAEMKALMGGLDIRSVLEFGCGDGELFAKLDFCSLDYTGVDFSDSMLSRFREHSPSARLVRGNALSYQDGQQYDLIFSSAVMQYLKEEQVEIYLNNIRPMVHEHTSVICASVPWKRLRHVYLTGEYYQAKRSLRGLFLRLLYWARVDPMGNWHELSRIRAIAHRCGYSVELFGSLCYIYRFHVLFRPL